MLELISVIVPIYKVEKYLERCIKSIVAQTYENIEIILVDDGSPDKCPQICDAWTSNDSRIRVIHKHNGGLSDARNAGLDIAKGMYVSFVDSDDYVHPQFIEVLYYIMKQQNADVVACEYNKVEEESSLELKADICCNDIQLKQISAITPATIGITAWNKLYKKSLFDNIRFPKGKIREDIGIWWKVAYYATNIVSIPTKLYYYCENPTSIMRKKFTMKQMDIIDVLYMQYIEFKEKSEDVYAGEILRECLNSYPGLYSRLKECQDFNTDNKRAFFKSYRKNVRLAISEKTVGVKVILKHLIYSYLPFTISCIYWQRKKDQTPW